MARNLYLSIFTVVSLFFVQSLAAQGTISGIITDALSKEPVIGATLSIQGTSRGTATGVDGRYELTNLSAGTYNIEISMITYVQAQRLDVVVHNSKSTTLNVELVETSEQLDEVVVSTVRRVSSVGAINHDIRNSMNVVSGVSSQTIGRTQDRDAGEVVRRIPGISIIDDKFIIARGLSQRYNNVWVNNAAVPSSEADSRSFSFDIIPAGQIENIMILKSPSPEIPADFTGGFIKINTKDIPSEDHVTVSYSIGVNTTTHFSKFLYNNCTPADLVGFGSSKRMVAGGISNPLDNNSSQSVDRLTRSGFNNDWSVKSKSPIPDQRFSLGFGKTLNLRNSAQLAFTGALNYSYSSRTYNDMDNARYGVYNKLEDRPEYIYKYVDDQYQTSVKVGAMFNMTYIKGDSRYYFRNIFNQIGQDRYTHRTGWQNISSLYQQEKAEYRYSSRSSYNGQLAGAHDFTNSRLDWNAGYSYANRNLPDRRIINLQQNDMVGDPYFGKMGIDQNEIQRDFTRLVEHMLSMGVNYEHTFRPGQSFAPKLKTGIYSEYRTRNYRTRDYYYRFNQSNLPTDFVYGDPVNDILQSGSYGADKLYIYDDTDNRDSYEGRNVLAAAYAGLNLPIGAFNIYAGVRYEQSEMSLVSYTRSDEWTSKTKKYNYTDLFPSVSATYKISEDHLLRAAYGMSTNRPEFREVSSSVYYDFDLFSNVMGNPDLKAAYIQNADLRYEWYPSAGENVSVSLFYKHFRNPIENTFRDAGGSYTYTFENAESANVYGIELDLRKNLDFMGMKNFSLSFNASLIKSKVSFGAGSLEHDRPMQGQSPYIINTGLFYQSPRSGWSFGVLYNRIGERIVGIGRVDVSSGGSVDNDIPDMYEMPRNALDVVISKKIGKCWEIKFNAKDVIGEDVRFSQFPKYIDSSGVVQQRTAVTKRYSPGRSFSLGVSAKF